MNRFWRVDKALEDSYELRWIRERLGALRLVQCRLGQRAARAALYMLAFSALGIGAPLQLLRNEESPYRFTERQVGPYGKDG